MSLLEQMKADAKLCNARLVKNGGYLESEHRIKERRQKIAAYLDLGICPAEIARIIGENQSTVCTDTRAIRKERGEL